MTNISASSLTHSPLTARLFRLRSLLESVPYSVLAIPLRLAVATVFWNSGTTKLASLDTTLQLFADEYRLPLLPPEIAARIRATVQGELSLLAT
jgi:putative oxidoreductase